MVTKKYKKILKIGLIILNFLLFFTITFFLLSSRETKDLNIFNTLGQKPAQNTSKTDVNPPQETLPVEPKFLEPQEVSSVTLESVFATSSANSTGSANLNLSLLDPNKLTTLIVTGDIIPARTTNQKMVAYNNFKYPFEKTADFLRSADLTFANLEAPLTKGCKPTTEGMTFCGNQKFITGLTEAGIDIMSLANNHSGNYGIDGINQTKALLTENGLEYTGVGNTLIKEVHGVKFAFLGFNGVGPAFNKEVIQEKIKDARQKADVVIVAPHWGKEYVTVPEVSPGVAPDDPREIARFIIDSGADLIIGNHPHWVQGVEIYKEKFIAYAHGNFIFDQMWSRETQEGVLGKYIFYDKKLIDVKFYPVIIEDYSQPRFLSKEEGQLILDRMKEASDKIAQSKVL